MRLLKLCLVGYRQFRQPTEICFPPEGLIGIVGPNGAGKSKIVEAISYALFGPRGPHLPSGDRDEDVRSYGWQRNDSFSITLEFEVGRERYRVVRAPGSVELYEGDASSAQVVGARDVTREIQRQTGLRPSTFVGTFVARQRDVAGLLAKDISQDQRIRLVNELIGVRQVEEAISLLGEEIRAREQAATSARMRIGQTSVAARAEVARRRAARLAASKTLANAERALERACALRGAAEDRVHELERQRAAFDEVAKRISLLNETIRGFVGEERRWAAELRRVARDERSLRRQEAIVGGKGELVAELERHQLLKELAHLRTERVRVERELSGPLARRLSQRKRAWESEQELGRILGQLHQARTTIKAEQAELQGRVDQLKPSLHRCSERLEIVRAMGPDGRCDRCTGVLGERYPIVCRALAAEQRDLARSIATARRWLTRSGTKVGAVERHISEFQDRRSKFQVRLSTDLGTVEGEILSATRRREELAAAVDRLASQLPRELRQSKYEPQVRAAVASRVAKIERIELEMATLYGRVARRVEVEGAIRRAQSEQLRTTEELRAAGQESAGLSHPKSDERRAAKRLERATATEREADQARTDRQSEMAEAVAQLQVAEGVLNRALAEEGELKTAVRLHQVAVNAREHLRALLTEFAQEAQPRLVQYMTEWMGPLFEGRFVQIDLTPDYRITADNGSGLREIAHFSGGEQTILALMLRAAIALFCRDRARFQSGFLILDEVFGDQDEQRRLQLIQFLEEIKPHYDQVLVVNHIEAVSGYFDRVIQVIPTSRNTSRVEVS